MKNRDRRSNVSMKHLKSRNKWKKLPCVNAAFVLGTNIRAENPALRDPRPPCPHRTAPLRAPICNSRGRPEAGWSSCAWYDSRPFPEGDRCEVPWFLSWALRRLGFLETGALGGPPRVRGDVSPDPKSPGAPSLRPTVRLWADSATVSPRARHLLGHRLSEPTVGTVGYGVNRLRRRVDT